MIQTESSEQYLRIKALEHLIDLGFDSEKSCHEVCYLMTQLLSKSNDEVSRMMAEVDNKALKSSVDIHAIN
jgi:hypothetical protein